MTRKIAEPSKNLTFWYFIEYDIINKRGKYARVGKPMEKETKDDEEYKATGLKSSTMQNHSRNSIKAPAAEELYIT